MLKKWFARQKLNVKFTIVIGAIVFLPIAVFTLMSFGNMQETIYEQNTNSLKYSMIQSYSRIQKTVDLCNTSTQIFLNYNNFTDYLVDVKNKKEITTSNIFDFYQNEISMLEKMVNSNPYLYQIRVYASGDNLTEMTPILYKRSRMDELKWKDTYESGEWSFDYTDTLFTKSASASEHMMGLITDIVDYDYGEIGVIEVVVRMEDVFDGIFENTDEKWGCFIDEHGNFYYDSGVNGSVFDNATEEILEKYGSTFDEDVYLRGTIAGQDVIIGILPVKEMAGTLINIMNMETLQKQSFIQQVKYLFLLIIIFVGLMFMINWIVKSLLKQFYEVFDTVTKIKDGDLAVRIHPSGQDEMALLGKQIDSMLDVIDILHKESINRELLMRNTEIKALQNQINAHFIYNVLESIKMMAEIDERYEISDAVTALGKLLRYGMKWSEKNVTVGQEIEYVKNYLELINLRFEYEIHLSISIPEVIYKQEIPKISLQPIVENAIYHGIEELAEDASIYIKAIIREDDFDIEITDSGKGMTKEQVERLILKIHGEIETSGGSGNGIGLKNVQDRIQISFGEQYGLSVASKEGCYTKVVVTLPFTHKAQIKQEGYLQSEV